MSKTSTVTYQVKTVYFPSRIKSNEEKKIKLGLNKSVLGFLTCYLKSLKNAAMPSTNSFGLVNYMQNTVKKHVLSSTVTLIHFIDQEQE